MNWTQKICALMFLVLGVTGCGTAVPTSSTRIPGTTATSSLPTDQAVSQWKSRCAQNKSGEPFSELTGLEPSKAIMLALDPKNQEWETSTAFPALSDNSGKPKYLVCIFRSWAFIASYLIPDKSLIIPGYREDWKITVQLLDTNKIYETQTLTGEEPAENMSFMRSPIALTEVVGITPLDEAQALLLGKLNR